MISTENIPQQNWLLPTLQPIGSIDFITAMNAIAAMNALGARPAAPAAPALAQAFKVCIDLWRLSGICVYLCTWLKLGPDAALDDLRNAVGAGPHSEIGS